MYFKCAYEVKIVFSWRTQYRALSIWLAIFAIYVMDFSINAGTSRVTLDVFYC